MAPSRRGGPGEDFDVVATNLCRVRPLSSRSELRSIPSGIPDAIIQSRADHRRPYPGDYGIRYQPKYRGAEGFAEWALTHAANEPPSHQVGHSIGNSSLLGDVA